MFKLSLKNSKMNLDFSALAAKFSWDKIEMWKNVPALIFKERYRPLLFLVAITILQFQTAGIFYNVLMLNALEAKPRKLIAAEAPPLRPVVKETLEYYKIILDRNLLNSTDRAVDEPQGAAEIPPIQSLIKLKATVAGSDTFGFAVFEEKARKKEMLIKIGRTISGATLIKVQREKVVVQYMGREETLKIEGTPEAPVLGSPSRTGASASASSSAHASSSSPQNATGDMTIRKSEIANSLKDIGQMLSQAQIRPYATGGVPAGFMVSNIRQGSIYHKLGIMDGDIIQEFDNRNLKSADDMMAFYNALKGGSNMNLTVKRGERQKTMRYTFN